MGGGRWEVRGPATIFSQYKPWMRIIKRKYIYWIKYHISGVDKSGVLTLRIGAPDDVLEECVLRRNQSTSSAWHFAGYTLQSSPVCPILSCYCSSLEWVFFSIFFFGARLAPLPLPLTTDHWQLGPGLYCCSPAPDRWQSVTDDRYHHQVTDDSCQLSVWEGDG